MAPTKAKTIAYRYKQDAKPDEDPFDPYGELTASVKH